MRYLGSGDIEGFKLRRYQEFKVQEISRVWVQEIQKFRFIEI